MLKEKEENISSNDDNNDGDDSKNSEDDVKFSLRNFLCNFIMLDVKFQISYD